MTLRSTINIQTDDTFVVVDCGGGTVVSSKQSHGLVPQILEVVVFFWYNLLIKII